MSGNISKFDDGEINKEEFHASKQTIALGLVNVYQILICGKFKYRDAGFKYFNGYKDDNISRPYFIPNEWVHKTF